MKTHIELKSALCGLVIGVFAMLAIGAGMSSNETGRYQITSGGNVALVIDTQTGKVWTKCWSSSAEFKSDADFSDSKLIEQKTP